MKLSELNYQLLTLLLNRSESKWKDCKPFNGNYLSLKEASWRSRTADSLNYDRENILEIFLSSLPSLLEEILICVMSFICFDIFGMKVYLRQTTARGWGSPIRRSSRVSSKSAYVLVETFMEMTLITFLVVFLNRLLKGLLRLGWYLGAGTGAGVTPWPSICSPFIRRILWICWADFCLAGIHLATVCKSMEKI